MQITEMHLEDVQAADSIIPKGSPVIMLNLVRYNAQADYGGSAEFPACSGREAYIQRYAPAFNKIAAAEGITGVEVLYLGSVMAVLAGAPDEQWDDLVLVKYPSFAAFRAVTESPRYAPEAYPHRKAALADWRLLATTQTSMPG